jgi:hypothetical protein
MDDALRGWLASKYTSFDPNRVRIDELADGAREIASGVTRASVSDTRGDNSGGAPQNLTAP